MKLQNIIMYKKIKNIDTLTPIDININENKYKIYYELICGSDYLRKICDNKSVNNIKIYDYKSKMVNEHIIDNILNYLYEGTIKEIFIYDYQLEINKNINVTNDMIYNILTYTCVSNFMSISGITQQLQELLYYCLKLNSAAKNSICLDCDDLKYLNSLHKNYHDIHKQKYLKYLNNIILNSNLNEDDLIQIITSNNYDVSTIEIAVIKLAIIRKETKKCISTVMILKDRETKYKYIINKIQECKDNKDEMGLKIYIEYLMSLHYV